MRKFEEILIFVFVFLLPTQLALHFWPDWAYVFGFRVDFLAPTVYLTDIVFLILVPFNLRIVKDFFYKHKKFLGLFLIFVFLNVFLSSSVFVSVYKWIKILEFICIGVIFKYNRFVNLNRILAIFLFSGVFFSIIGILQFIKGATLGGVLYYLGERLFSASTPSVALVNLWGREYMRAYSTFSHPNSLAGFLGSTFLLILLSKPLKKNTLNILALALMVICVLLTFSFTVAIGLFLIFVFYGCLRNKKLSTLLIKYFFVITVIASLVFLIFSSSVSKNRTSLLPENIRQRVELSAVAANIVNSKFFTGSGLGTFIINIPRHGDVFYGRWVLQPVHNIYLLVFAELGVIGVSLFCFFIYKFFNTLVNKNRFKFLLVFLFILFTGLTDHYNLTLQQNTLLLSILIGLSLR